MRALVYLNAFALDEGESALQIAQKYTDQKLASGLITRPFPQADGTAGTDLHIDPSKFREIFAADLPASETNLMATAQRPIAQAALQAKSTAPAWKTIPSWYLVGRQDEAIDPAAERFMAKRAHAHTVEINASHASFLSHPDAVDKLIVQAAKSIH